MSPASHSKASQVVMAGPDVAETVAGQGGTSNVDIGAKKDGKMKH